MANEAPAETPAPKIEAVDLKTVIDTMRDYLDQRTTDRLTINQRLDFLVKELGGVHELVHRVDLHDKRITEIGTVEQTMIALLKDTQELFDTRTQVVLKDAEMLRNTVRDATLAFQTAQESQNSDWDDRFEALRVLIDKLQAADATVTVSRIGRSERIWITVITVIGGALVALISTLVLRALHVQ